ncbi:exo-beta-N-acetylmuramidase NamZ family protein [Oceanobacillus sp. CF4.6]|uniref:exo-beta-N-acetylmuramidase NamZ family protein n=1 Tax=Oceanobacillus sp. CF4.6 TaxID=3373080 RepID=UPI003EE4845F
MKRPLIMFLTIVLALSSLSAVFADNGNNGKGKGKDKQNELELGVEVLLEEQKELIKGKRVGLITNPTGVDQELRSIVDLLHHDPDVELTALYGPEHGVRGDAQAGEYVEFYIDGTTGLPVYSLYGQTRKPTPEMLENVDVLLFDIQDVGTRFYTYIYTMAYAMEAAQENNIEFIVLDRPNPQGGHKVEGPVLETEYASFVGNYPIPLRHGMTVGELAKLFNEEFEIGADLTVVEMDGWKRNMYYDDTDLEFVLPSPNMPTLDTALVYPGAALIEGTNLSEGRGTTKPFELIGAPFVNSTAFAAALNELELPGVAFRAASFTPSISKHAGTLSHGVQIHIKNKKSYKPVETGLHIVKTLHDMYPEDFEFRAENSAGISFFDNLIGNGWIREAIENGDSVKDMEKEWKDELKEFKQVRKDFLIY